MTKFPLLFFMTRAELQRRYAGTVFGAVWAFLAPLVLIGAIWFALDVGLGMRTLIGPEYGILFVLGMVSWIAFSDCISDATTSIVRNPHLVKKVVFPIELLPLISVATSYLIHMVMLLVAGMFLFWSGYLEATNIWALPVLVLVSIILASGLALGIASINIIARDTQSIVPLLLTVWFWLTPIIWPISKVPENWRWILALNPLAVIVEGYRSALTIHPFIFSVNEVILSILVSLAAIGMGILFFNRLRPVFSDLL